MREVYLPNCFASHYTKLPSQLNPKALLLERICSKGREAVIIEAVDAGVPVQDLFNLMFCSDTEVYTAIEHWALAT